MVRKFSFSFHFNKLNRLWIFSWTYTNEINQSFLSLIISSNWTITSTLFPFAHDAICSRIVNLRDLRNIGNIDTEASGVASYALSFIIVFMVILLWLDEFIHEIPTVILRLIATDNSSTIFHFIDKIVAETAFLQMIRIRA